MTEMMENGDALAFHLGERESEDEIKIPLNGNKGTEVRNGDVHKNGEHKVSNGTTHHPEQLQVVDTDLAHVKEYPYWHNDEVESSTTCGMWSFKPSWLQPFANKKAFLVVFCLTSVLQGMYYTYFVSVLTTIEKLFQIQSKTTGIIMSATEIGQIGGALLLTYYGGQGHRPKWIAGGMLVFAVASILCSTPHFLFGGDHTLTSQSSPSVLNASAYKLRELNARLCHVTQLHTRNNITYVPNIQSLGIGPQALGSTQLSRTRSEDSDDVTESESTLGPTKEPFRHSYYKGRAASKCDSPDITTFQTRVTHVVLSVFFFSLLLIGIGATAVYTLGIPYIDDNVATRESPLYFGITIGVRIFGPVFGFLLGSFCTSVYVNFPFGNPGITSDDPQWIGAWWLGVFIVGAALIVTSFPMMGFPRELPQKGSAAKYHLPSPATKNKLNGIINPQYLKHQQQKNGVKKSISKKPSLKNKPSLKDFPAAMKRLLRNDILLFRTASSVLHILPIAGLYTFLPKYLESQFQLSATKANMISGMAGILVMGAGIFASGTFMRKYKPNASFVARWIAISALAYSVGMVILMWLGCPLNNFVGLNETGEPGLAVQACNVTCECRLGEFAPICSTEGKTYLSPCVAGCTKVKQEGDTYSYIDCQCLGEGVTAVNGYCELECDNLTWYIIIFSLFVLIHSTSEVGSMLLTLRCVDPKDKAMALGLISFAIGLFGNVPCPIIYGAVVDSACLFWEDNCGEPGACRVYDPNKFRMVFHGLTAIIMLAAFVVDALVCYKASSVRFHEDEDQPKDLNLAIMTNGNGGPQSESTV